MSMCLFSYSLRLVIVTSLSLLVCECFRNSPHWKNSLIYRKSYESTQLTTLVYSRALTSTPNTAGSDALGFSSNLSTKRFQLETQVIFGSNAIEHGINLIEEKTRNILLLSGWNNARLDPVLWELEPRGFQLHVCSISEEPTCENILQIIAAALQCNCGAIIAMGCGSVLDSAKLATMLINSHEDIESLANMSPIALEEYLVCYNEREYHKPDLCRVLLVTVPALPSMGAELSDIVALKKIIWQPNAVQNKDEMDNSAYSVAPLLLVDEEQLIGAIPQQESVYVAQPKNRDICKMYVRAVNPDLSLVQPSLTYRAPMELVHDRLIALLATSIDIILSDPGFLPEMLAWDALRELVLLLDSAIEKAEERFTQWINDPDSFEKQTVHDDERDHRSQDFRRYGHGFDMSTIENMCRAGISIATAKSNMPIGGLQYLSDSLGQIAGCKGGYTTRVGKLLPSYLLGLQQWCDIIDEESSKEGSTGKPSTIRNREKEGRSDPFKSFIRTKLDRISQVLQTSRYISYHDEKMMSLEIESGTINIKGGNLKTEIEGEIEKEVIGETCGQVMPTAVSTAQNLDPRSPGILLTNQMDKLRFHSRLLAGPLNDEEEADVDPHKGDSLTLLRKKLTDRTDTEKELAKKELKSFNPSEFEKYEKENFVISDHISEDEMFFSWSRRKTDDYVSSRSLPRVAVSDLECHNILMDMRRVCGDSPVTHLTPEILKSILSDEYGQYGAVTSSSMTIDGQHANSDRVSDNSAYGDNDSESNINSNIGDLNRVAEEYSLSAAEDNSDDYFHQSTSLNPVENVASSSADVGSRDIAISAVSTANDDAYCIAKETLIDLTKNVRTTQAVIPEFHGTVEMNYMSGVNVDVDVDVKIDVTSQEVNISAALIVDVAKKIPEDPAAAHRRKVKKLLAELNSIDSIRDEDRLGGVKERSVDSANSNSNSRGGYRDVKASEKREESESTLIEQQTDVLARLLEQRIHDRWAQASAESQVQSPFKNKN